MKIPPISVYMDENDKEELKILAKKNRVLLATYLRHVLQDHIKVQRGVQTDLTKQY
jgi:hypothetical protein